MNRRKFIAIAGGASFAISQPVSPQAQSGPFGKVGILSFGRVSTSTTVTILRAEWQRLGYVEGEHVLLRGAEGDAMRLPGLVAELVGLKVRVIIAIGVGPVTAARQGTSTTPIVAIDLETDPVRAGYAVSFSRPTGNVTGLFMDMPSVAGKWIELLQEVAPTIKQVALIWDPATGPDQLESAKAAARSKRVDTVVIEANTAENYDEDFKVLAPDKPTGVVHLTAPAVRDAFPNIVAAAQKYQLPIISFQRINAQAGALLTYGPRQESYFPRAMMLADRIVKGANVKDLPIERPIHFELVVNLRTAKSMGISMPQSILLRADEVIE